MASETVAGAPSVAEMVARLAADFPASAIKSRIGRGNVLMSYVDTKTVIRRLNEATGGHWELHVLNLDWRPELLVATVALTIPGLGRREHMGIQEIGPKQGGDLVKGAVSDGLKKAATLFGVGLDLYGTDDDADDGAPGPSAAAARPATHGGGTGGAPAAAGGGKCEVCGAEMTKADAAWAAQFKKQRCGQHRKD